MARHRVGFARWRSDSASGGNRYDDELSAALRALGVAVREYAVPGSWPLPDGPDRRHLVGLLESEQDWLTGNIIGSAVPEAIAAATAAGRRVTLLMHYFPTDDPGLPAYDRQRLAASEAEAVSAASAVITTSAWAAEQIATRYGRDDAVVAPPGIGPATIARGSAGTGRPALLWLGRLTLSKDPLTFIDALTRLGDLDWTARLVGPDAVDADLSRLVRDRIAAAGLAGRVDVVGALHDRALDEMWSVTDLLVHTSRFETYGMVVAEALARGIPSVVARGTGAVEAQQVGETFAPGDAEALVGVLREWLTNPALRRSWRSAAAERRGHLPTWSVTARIVRSVLLGGGRG